MRTQAERNVFFLFLDTTTQGILAGGILAFMPIFIVRLGGSSLLVSLLTALPALGIILFSIPAAQIVARRQDMVHITVMNRLFFHGLFLLITLAPFVLDASLAVVTVALWSLQAIPSAISNVSWTEVIAQAIPMERMGRVNGTRWAVYSVVIAISSAFFGMLLQRIPQPINYQIVFFASFLSGLASTYFFSRIKLKPTYYRPRPVLPTTKLREKLRELAVPLTESAGFRAYLAVGFLIRLGLSLPVALYSIYWVNTLQATDQLIGWRMTVGSLALVAGYAFWGRSIARVGYRRGLTLAGLGIALYPGLTALVGTPAWLLPVALVWGFFAAGIDINIFDGLLRICPASDRANYVAMNTVIANLAVFLGPILGSLVSNLIGIRPAFVVALVVGVIGAALVSVLQMGAAPAPVPEPVPAD